MNLREYRQVAAGRKSPKYIRSGPTVLALKIEIADRMLRECCLCERRCGVDRANGQLGFCGAGETSRYFFEQTLWGEEKPLVPSHEVFFSGCNMRCRFCYSWEQVADPALGEEVIPAEFAKMVDSRRQEGAVNLNLIGGEPTVNLPSILKVLRLIKNPTPIVWNSNFFMSTETMHLLDGVVDLYLGDFRFGNDKCASEVADTNGYFEAAVRNFKTAVESGDVIIRHLLLPGHVECCLRPIAEWTAKNLPDVPFNLMFQYTPCSHAEDDPLLGRMVTNEEQREAAKIVRSLGLNTSRWNRPLPNQPYPKEVGKGEFSTTITIESDGRVVIKHLHGDLLDLVRALKIGE